MPTPVQPAPAKSTNNFLAELAASDPVYAHTIKAIKMVEDSLFPRKRTVPERMCKCGGTAVWDYKENHWDCEDCQRTWAA